MKVEGMLADIFGIRWNTLHHPSVLEVLVADEAQPGRLLWIEVPAVSSYQQIINTDEIER